MPASGSLHPLPPLTMHRRSEDRPPRGLTASWMKATEGNHASVGVALPPSLKVMPVGIKSSCHLCISLL
jgi:hypothetical protein